MRISFRVALGATALLAACESYLAPLDKPDAGDVAMQLAPESKIVTIVPGQSRQLRLLHGAPESVWWSEDAGVVAVSASGVVFGANPGATHVMVQTPRRTDTALVTVRRLAARVDLPSDSIDIGVGAKEVVTIRATDASGQPIESIGSGFAEWTSSSPSVIQVDSSGAMTAVSVGTAIVSVRIDGKSDSATVSVVDAAVASVSVRSAEDGPLLIGKDRTLSAVATDASGRVLARRPITWSSSDPGVAKVSASGTVTAIRPGNAQISAATEGQSATVTIVATESIATGAPVTAPEVSQPAVFLTTSLDATPSNGRTVHVNATDNLQAVLDSVRPGDHVLLARGAQFVGNFTFGPRSGGVDGGWITVETEGAAPAEGVRVTPETAAGYASLVSSTILPALSTNGPARRWRFIGLELTNQASESVVNGTVQLGDASAAQNSMDNVPTDIILDRVYVHSPANTDDRRCVTINTARTAIIDSYIAGCKSAFDAQSIAGTNGPGPFKIVNNYLEASGENVAFGGADPGISNLVPSDIEIRRNYFTKPMAWKNGPWLVKNLLELKAGRRVLIDGNIFENSWPAAQAGFAFVLWSVNQGGTCTWCVTEHVTVQNNIIRNVASGFQLTARWTGQPALAMNHIAIRNNVIMGLNNASVSAGASRLYQIGDAIPQLVIEHNTGFAPDAGFLWGGDAPLPSHIVRNNLTGGGWYPIYTAYGQGALAWSREAGAGSDFSGNVVALASTNGAIPNNYYPASMDAVGLIGGAASAYNPGASLQDLTLSANSPYKARGTDGADPGADIAAVAKATAGVDGR
jgi:Big-like domain-containing protein